MRSVSHSFAILLLYGMPPTWRTAAGQARTVNSALAVADTCLNVSVLRGVLVALWAMRALRKEVARASRPQLIWRTPTTALGLAITHVVGLRAAKQVLVAHAWGPVAVMENAVIFRD